MNRLEVVIENCYALKYHYFLYLDEKVVCSQMPFSGSRLLFLILWSFKSKKKVR